ncbi:MAG: phosphate signaling complex protein PhoU [Chloroflexi bacterium]|nr:phosphate signaling complex protein PhoU [Chloroflexota bacterium]
MARPDFDRELAQLEADVVLLGSLVESAAYTALEALRTRDRALIEKVMHDDDLIDGRRRRVQQVCVELIRREAPVASDLRRIVTAWEVAGELERMGDYAEGIAKIGQLLRDHPGEIDLFSLPQMADRAIGMLKHSLEALLERDEQWAVELARRVEHDDEAVDQMYAALRAELIERMRNDPNFVETGTYLLWAAHNLERIADRSTNIAETVEYQATGRIPASGAQQATGSAPGV